MALEYNEQNGVVKSHPLVNSILQPATWFRPECLHPQIESLIYWRNVKKSGLVFGAGVGLIFTIACISIVRIMASAALFLLIGGMIYRCYKYVMNTMQITPNVHQIDQIFEINVYISPERARILAGVAIEHFNARINSLRRLFAVEDVHESLKFGVILLIMTYIGSWFNGLTLFLLLFIFLFTVPKIYENHKAAFDNIFNLGKKKYGDSVRKIRTSLTGTKKDGQEDIMGKPAAIEMDKDK